MEGFTIIHAYTRRQALADGVLVDVSEMAQEAGVKFPTAVTAAVWAQYVEVPDGVGGQDVEGRLWDILWMFRNAARSCHGSEIHFQLHVRNDNRPGEPPLVTLKAVVGPGDDPEPVITIMMSDED
jgi:hypothetical protein